MENLLQKAVLSLEQKQIKEIFVEDEDFYVEKCDCQDLDELFKGILLDFGDLKISEINTADYIDENSDVLGFIMDLLNIIGIEEDEINNYVCETTIEDSFLDIEQINDFYIITPDFEKLMAFYTTYLEA